MTFIQRVTGITSLSIVLLMIAGCSHPPYYASNKSYRKQAASFAAKLKQTPSPADSSSISPYWIGTTNFNMRKPNFVIIHHTAQNSCEQTLQTFTTTKSQVSAHYVICKDGTIHHMLNDYLRAWQAGNSKWGNVTDVNSVSIGIELDNNGYEPFPETQITSLLQLLGRLKKEYGIPTANFIGHADIAPRRKDDPNVFFPWKKLSEQGFGLWYDNLPSQPDSNFNSLLALRIIGYDVKDTSAAILAFKRHFMQDTTSRVLNDADKQVLNNLYRKY